MPGGTNTGMSRLFVPAFLRSVFARNECLRGIKLFRFAFAKYRIFSPSWHVQKKHKACCKKYKALILKYVPCISKYMPYIFREKRHLIISDL